MSISDKHQRSPNRRPYRMRRRAEQVDQTRQRITEAAVHLHTSVGPANTSIASVANEAGVTRLTVYRHFADLDSLFEACIGHWSAANPMPDVNAWRAIDSLEARARKAFADLYRWYQDRDVELYPIYRDWTTMPESAQHRLETDNQELADAMLGRSTDTLVDRGKKSRVLDAVARHLVDFWTWRSLAIDRGLGLDEAVDAAVLMLLAAEGKD